MRCDVAEVAYCIHAQHRKPLASLLLGHGDEKGCVPARSATHATQALLERGQERALGLACPELPEPHLPAVAAEQAGSRQYVVGSQIADPNRVSRAEVRVSFSHANESRSALGMRGGMRWRG